MTGISSVVELCFHGFIMCMSSTVVYGLVPQSALSSSGKCAQWQFELSISASLLHCFHCVIDGKRASLRQSCVSIFFSLDMSGCSQPWRINGFSPFMVMFSDASQMDDCTVRGALPMSDSQCVVFVAMPLLHSAGCCVRNVNGAYPVHTSPSPCS